MYYVQWRGSLVRRKALVSQGPKYPPLSYLNKLAATIGLLIVFDASRASPNRAIDVDRSPCDRKGSRYGAAAEDRTGTNDGSDGFAIAEARIIKVARTRPHDATTPGIAGDILDNRLAREMHFHWAKITNNAERFHYRRSRRETARSVARMREPLAIRVSFAPGVVAPGYSNVTRESKLTAKII